MLYRVLNIHTPPDTVETYSKIFEVGMPSLFKALECLNILRLVLLVLVGRQSITPPNITLNNNTNAQ